MKQTQVIERAPVPESPPEALHAGVRAAPAEVQERRYITGALMLTMVLVSMEQTIASTAMPTIIGELHGIEHYSWVASIYLLASTVTMPLYGRLADAFGRKRVVLTAIGIFCLGSTLSAFAQTMPQLIVFRGLQGLGAGGVMPVVLTILGDIFTLKERARIQGVFSAVWGTSALAGPALGAFLVNTLGWRSIFFVNLPFGVLALSILIWKYQDREKPHVTDLDLLGAVGLAVTCMSLLLLVSGMGPEGWSAQMMLTLLAITATAAWLFIRHERRVEHPLLSPTLMSHPDIGPAMLGSLLMGAGFLCLDTYVPLYVQGARGGGATAAAAVVTPVMFSCSLSALVAMPLVVRWGFRKTALLGAGMLFLGFAGLFLGAVFEAPRWVLTAVLLLAGAGIAPASMSYLLSAQDAVTWQQRGGVTSSVTFCRTIGGAMGIGLLGALFNVLMHGTLTTLHEQNIPAAAALDPGRHGEIPTAMLDAVHAAIGRAMVWLFAAMVVIAVLQVLATMRLRARHATHAVTPVEVMESIGT